jgi:hypothetical protein
VCALAWVELYQLRLDWPQQALWSLVTLSRARAYAFSPAMCLAMLLAVSGFLLVTAVRYALFRAAHTVPDTDRFGSGSGGGGRGGSGSSAWWWSAVLSLLYAPMSSLPLIPRVIATVVRPRNALAIVAFPVSALLAIAGFLHLSGATILWSGRIINDDVVFVVSGIAAFSLWSALRVRVPPLRCLSVNALSLTLFPLFDFCSDTNRPFGHQRLRCRFRPFVRAICRVCAVQRLRS